MLPLVTIEKMFYLFTGSEVRKASPDGALSEAMTSSVETYEHSEEGGTWQPRDYRNTDDDTNHAHHHEDERYYENQMYVFIFELIT